MSGRAAPTLDSADNVALAGCTVVAPADHLSTCTIACFNASYVPDGANTNATFTCVKGQWVPPASDQLACQRSCLSDNYCTGLYQLNPGWWSWIRIRVPDVFLRFI
jgi:hypothetical protein